MFQQGSLSRLLLAVLTAVVFLTMLTLQRPYLSKWNNYLSIGLNFSLLCYLILCVGFQMGDFVEQTGDTISQEYREQYDFNSVLMTIVTMLFTLAGVVLFVAFFFNEIRQQVGMRKWVLRYADSDKEVAPAALSQNWPKYLKPKAECGQNQVGPFHLFLSHNWAQGQDEARIIKTRLREIIPKVEVFLGGPPASSTQFLPLLK